MLARSEMEGRPLRRPGSWVQPPRRFPPDPRQSSCAGLVARASPFWNSPPWSVPRRSAPLRALRCLAGAIAFAWIISTSSAETLTIATYNVENYVTTNRMTDAGYRTDYPKPESEKAALRQVIRRLNVDVLVLQEMGQQKFLDELQRDLKRAGSTYPYALLLSGPDVDRHVAILSKRPFVSSRAHSDLGFTYFAGKEKVKRGILEVALNTAVGDVTLFGLHLKSRFTDRPDDPRSSVRREGEATAIRDLVLSRFPDPASSRFVILGDFNDDKSSKTLQRFDHRGQISISQLLPIADSHGESWTHLYKKEDSFTRVDHILVSPGLLSAVRGGAGVIEDGVGVREASDHRPVKVTLSFPDKD